MSWYYRTRMQRGSSGLCKLHYWPHTSLRLISGTRGAPKTTMPLILSTMLTSHKYLIRISQLFFSYIINIKKFHNTHIILYTFCTARVDSYSCFLRFIIKFDFVLVSTHSLRNLFIVQQTILFLPLFCTVKYFIVISQDHSSGGKWNYEL